MNLPDTENVSRIDLAKILGITPQHVTNLFREGIFQQSKKGKYDLCKTVQAWGEYKERGKVHTELMGGRKKLDDIKARKEELLLKKLEGRSLDIEEVQVVVTSAMQVICTAMDGQAGRLSHELASESDPAAIRQKLLNENREIRQAAADKLQLLGSIRHDGRESKAAAVKKSRSVGKPKQSTAKRKRRTRAVAK